MREDDDIQRALPGFEPPPPPAPRPPPPIIEAPTPEQRAIIEYVRSGDRHVIVEALAGAGKTSTILQSLVTSTAARVLLTSFGNAIVATLEERLPKAPPGRTWQAKTLHRAGLGVLRSYGWEPDPDDDLHGIHSDASEKLVNDMATSIEEIVTEENNNSLPLWFDLPFVLAEKVTRAVISDDIRRAASELLKHWKLTCLPHSDVSSVQEEDSVDALDNIKEEEEPLARTIAHFAYVMGARLDRTKIDFEDMIWLPLVLDLMPKWPYDLIFVDEAQDLNRPQFALTLRLMKPDARLIVVGDLYQSMYGWRGAVGDEVWKTLRAMGARTMPLTVSFRCPRVVVEMANQLVPDLRARDGAPLGKIHACSFTKMIDGLPNTTIQSFVLSRNNAVLFETAIQLWRRGALFNFSKGEELAKGLHALVDHLMPKGAPQDLNSFLVSLDTWHEQAVEKAKEKKALSKIDRLDQKRLTLLALLKCTEPRGLHALLRRLTSSRDAVVKLATVHGTKGLEADRVYLLRQTFARYSDRSPDQDAIPQEELNIEYVAITRSKSELVWVDLPKEEA